MWLRQGRHRASGDADDARREEEKKGGMVKRARLDKLLVDRGLAATRAEARRRILGGDVLVHENPGAKAGSLVDDTAPIRLTKARVYVSRGGEKLEKALADFAVEVKGKIALDVGASTG